METFPTGVLISYPMPKKSAFKTLVTDLEGGKEQRHRKWVFPKRAYPLTFKAIEPGSMKDVWKFFHERAGAHEGFWFIDPDPDYWYGEYLGQGDGSQTYFDLACVAANQTVFAVSVYVDGVSSNFSFVSGGGEGGSDRVHMGIAPNEGAIVTGDFYGQLRLRARFQDAEMSKELYDYLIYNAGITIIEDKLSS